MEWAALVTWALVAAIGLAIARRAGVVVPPLGVQALAAIGALILSLLFVVLDDPRRLEWAAFALGVAGFAAATAGVPRLIDDEREVGPAGESAEEVAALLTPAQIALFAAAAGLTLLAALGVATVT
jgi:hypothetical protein